MSSRRSRKHKTFAVKDREADLVGSSHLGTKDYKVAKRKNPKLANRASRFSLACSNLWNLVVVAVENAI
jgi:hypothetical protein